MAAFLTPLVSAGGQAAGSVFGSILNKPAQLLSKAFGHGARVAAKNDQTKRGAALGLTRECIRTADSKIEHNLPYVVNGVVQVTDKQGPGCGDYFLQLDAQDTRFHQPVRDYSAPAMSASVATGMVQPAVVNPSSAPVVMSVGGGPSQSGTTSSSGSGINNNTLLIGGVVALVLLVLAMLGGGHRR